MTKTLVIYTGFIEKWDPWDPDSIHKGISGSEEAVIYMSQQLAELGYQVLVLGNPPLGSCHSLPQANPRYVHSSESQFSSMVDVAIAWRLPKMGKEIKKLGRKAYLWPHDTLFVPVTDEEAVSFDDVLWLSEWQRQQYSFVQPAFSKYTKIFGNGINPKHFRPLRERSNPYSCIYSSSYDRGLQILLDLWPSIIREQPLATLDLYYGWKNWGVNKPEEGARIREQIASLPNICEHGMVGHQELTLAYESTSFWTYPCTAPETFCITALKAQLAGAIPVVIDGSALYETVKYGYKCAKPEEYFSTLMRAFQMVEKITIHDRRAMGDFILKDFTWKQVARKWNKLFKS